MAAKQTPWERREAVRLLFDAKSARTGQWVPVPGQWFDARGNLKRRYRKGDWVRCHSMLVSAVADLEARYPAWHRFLWWVWSSAQFERTLDRPVWERRRHPLLEWDPGVQRKIDLALSWIAGRVKGEIVLPPWLVAEMPASGPFAGLPEFAADLVEANESDEDRLAHVLIAEGYSEADAYRLAAIDVARGGELLALEPTEDVEPYVPPEIEVPETADPRAWNGVLADAGLSVIQPPPKTEAERDRGDRRDENAVIRTHLGLPRASFSVYDKSGIRTGKQRNEAAATTVTKPGTEPTYARIGNDAGAVAEWFERKSAYDQEAHRAAFGRGKPSADALAIREDVAERSHELRAMGANLEPIADHLGCSEETVSKLLKKYPENVAA